MAMAYCHAEHKAQGDENFFRFDWHHGIVGSIVGVGVLPVDTHLVAVVFCFGQKEGLPSHDAAVEHAHKDIE